MQDGAITGFIDLLFRGPDKKFYILDWKTNVIGKNLDNFGLKGLKAEMDHANYHFQYLIYIVAFLQYYCSLNPDWELNEKNYDELFGGVFYVFLRGITQESGHRGFFAIRPSFKLVSGLAERLSVTTQEG